MSLAADSGVRAALGAVQRRARLLRVHASVRHALWGVALGLTVLGVGRLLGLITLSLTVAVMASAAVGTVYGLLDWWRSPAPTPLDAARTADRRAALSGLLTTALTLPEHPTQPWEKALHARVQARAHEAAATLNPTTLLPVPAARVWLWPAALVAVAACLWWPAPVTLERAATEVPRAQAVDEPTESLATPSTPEAATDTSSPVVNEPTPEPEIPEAQAATTAAPQGGPTSDVASVAAPAGQPGAVAGTGGTAARSPLREARQGVTPGTAGDSSSVSAVPGGRTQDTPFGSRESGQFQNQSVTPAENLASAPYDPSTTPGAQAMQQKSDPGSSGLRAASGGRGIESEGADRCVQGCLTNNDMNRGAQPASGAARKKPGGETQSGTSDSGGGAAGSSSGVGLGVGTLNPIQSSAVTELGGAGVLGDRIQVLAAPERVPTTLSTAAATGTGGWQAASEAPTPTTDIPPDTRATVRSYFDRTTPPDTTSPDPARTAP
ncbi:MULTISPECIES: hypothetical protein [Deinococcus]|uniref:Uncharacterized protein n=1 Tax=Deinococcus rufus TaxID=2136097 RepID=A0ABV7ZG85_9DEIO|nr:hypothetical protein [Deinococcus sp. AB2017081]WQE93651.1 hypothetical protein U2P90_09525 [Deinococcus sp. AB2017081]